MNLPQSTLKSFMPALTGGLWTRTIAYNPNSQTMTVAFQNGHVHDYENIDKNRFDSIKAGTETKDGRGGSVGAALWQEGLVR